jgi:hypothetical protein
MNYVQLNTRFLVGKDSVTGYEDRRGNPYCRYANSGKDLHDVCSESLVYCGQGSEDSQQFQASEVVFPSDGMRFINVLRYIKSLSVNNIGSFYFSPTDNGER